MTSSRTIALLAAAVGLVACVGGESSTSDTWQGRVDTLPGGTIMVHNLGAGLWDTSAAWRLEQDLVIGAVDGLGPEVFGEIAAVHVGTQGRIYVLEEQAQEIRVFDSAGTYLRTVGSKGAGPGELAAAFGLASDDLDWLWVPDVGNRRLTVFDSTGEFAEDYQRPLGVVYPFLGGFDKSGRFWDVTLSFNETHTSFFFVSFVSITSAFDSVPPVRYRRDVGNMTRTMFFLRSRMTLAFDPAGYIWFGSTGDYRLLQRSMAGDTVRIVERDTRRVSVSDAERETILAEIAELPFPVDPALIPTEKPAFNRIVVGDDGHLFVNVPGSDDEEGRLIDVFDADGLYLGRLTAPVPLEWLIPPRFGPNHVVGVTRDELDVPYVVRLRMVTPE